MNIVQNCLFKTNKIDFLNKKSSFEFVLANFSMIHHANLGQIFASLCTIFYLTIFSMHNILLDPHHYILCLISKLMHLMLGKSCRQIIVCIGKNNLCRPFRTKVWLDVFGNWSSAELCINMYMLLMLLYILFIGYWFEYWLWMDFKYFSNKGFKYFWQWNLPPGVESISVLRIAKKNLSGFNLSTCIILFIFNI